MLADWNLFEEFHYDTYNFLRHGALRVNDSWLDAATDLAQTSYATAGTRTTFNIGNYYGGGGYAELIDTWESRYRGIRKANWVLAHINEVPKNPKNSDEVHAGYVKNFTAEARFFRAFFYWEMFLRYGPLPIITTVLSPDQDMITPYTKRPTTKEYVVDFILRNSPSVRLIFSTRIMHGPPSVPDASLPACCTCPRRPHQALHGITPLCSRERNHMAGCCRCSKELHG